MDRHKRRTNKDSSSEHQQIHAGSSRRTRPPPGNPVATARLAAISL